MRLSRESRVGGEGLGTLLVILLVSFGGIAWWLFSSRQDAEKNARAFAEEVVRHVAVDYDEKYLHVHLSPAGQITYLQSWRENLINQLRGLGAMQQPFKVTGKLEFSSYFFDPHGTFNAELPYSTTTAHLTIEISRGMTVWQVDTLNLMWTPTATPTPIPVIALTPSPSPMLPSPTPPPSKPKRKSKP